MKSKEKLAMMSLALLISLLSNSNATVLKYEFSGRKYEFSLFYTFYLLISYLLRNFHKNSIKFKVLICKLYLY